MKRMEQRKEFREQIIGDICWSYASEKNENLGVLIEESKSGLSIMTTNPLKTGSILRVECKNSLLGTRYVTVQWCQEITPNHYRSGLSVIKHY
jgi:hypothetical protein